GAIARHAPPPAQAAGVAAGITIDRSHFWHGRIQARRRRIDLGCCAYVLTSSGGAAAHLAVQTGEPIRTAAVEGRLRRYRRAGSAGRVRPPPPGAAPREQTRRGTSPMSNIPVAARGLA